MFIRITRGSFDPNRQPDATALTEEQLFVAITALPGCRGYYGGTDQQLGRTVTVTLWDTAVQAAALRQALGETIMQGIAEAGLQLEESEVYEVTQHA